SAGMRPSAMSGSSAAHVAPSSPMTRTRSLIPASGRLLSAALLLFLADVVANLLAEIGAGDEPLPVDVLNVDGQLLAAAVAELHDGLGVAHLLNALGNGRDLVREHLLAELAERRLVEPRRVDRGRKARLEEVEVPLLRRAQDLVHRPVGFRQVDLIQ